MLLALASQNIGRLLQNFLMATFWIGHSPREPRIATQTCDDEEKTIDKRTNAR